MNKFDLAFDNLMKLEGGLSNHKYDKGGLTQFGISLRYLKSIGELGDLNLDGEVNEKDVESLTFEDSKQHYKTYWWDKYDYEKIDCPSVAVKIFEMAVHMGSTQAHILLQRAICAVFGNRNHLQQDGILGPKTLLSLNVCESNQIVPCLRCEAAAFYRSLNNGVFINGWLNRAYS